MTNAFSFVFFVAANVTVDYDKSLDGILLGRGTNTLVILGNPGRPPSCLERVTGLRDAVDATNSPMEIGLLRILDQLGNALSSGDFKNARALLDTFVRVVEGAITGSQIEPVPGQLLIDRAKLIERPCLPR